MTDILTRALNPSEQVVDTEVGDETVLLHLGNGTYYGLDALGTRIWAQLRQGISASAICAAIAEDYGIGQAEAEADARRFLADLEAHDILVSG